jgi:hypothetical protein
MSEMVELVAKAIREEIVRQYRDDDRSKFPAGLSFWEEQVQPWLIARAAIVAIESVNKSRTELSAN